MDKTLDPPAAVKSACTFKEAALRVKALKDRFLRRSLEDVVEIGAALRVAKDQCIAEGHSWSHAVNETGYPKSTADRYIRCFDNKTELGAILLTVSQSTITDMLNMLAGPDPPEEPAQRAQTDAEAMGANPFQAPTADPVSEGRVFPWSRVESPFRNLIQQVDKALDFYGIRNNQVAIELRTALVRFLPSLKEIVE